jgi:hypothetical protein
MNLLLNGSDSSRPAILPLRFQEFEPSWAGPHPFRDGFCFGSEDGKLLFTDEEGKSLSGGPAKGSVSGEAINGIAGWQSWLAVSTREEVNLIALPTTAAEKIASVTFPCGAHDVIATPSGYFAAPLGRSGLMIAKPSPNSALPVTIINGPVDEHHYLYRVACVVRDGKEILVCAMRNGGVGATEFQTPAQKHAMNSITFDGLDVVDVCGIGPAGTSLATCAVGKDGTFLLFRDILNDKKPVTLKYDNIQGTAYRLLRWHGHLCLLTSKGLHFLAKLAERFLAGDAMGETKTPLLFVPLTAVDANLCFERWLLVVMPDEVRRYDIGLILENVPDGPISDNSHELNWPRKTPLWEVQAPHYMTPFWKERDIDQHSEAALSSVI